MAKLVYKFGMGDNEGGAKDAKLLGGKGANLAEMAKLGLPVPPGFTFTTELCEKYQMSQAAKGVEASKFFLVNEIGGAIDECLKVLESHFGYAPLLSVRSGAPVSMPGMMDTILNVGLTSDNLEEWSNRIGERATYDSYRRLIQMLSNVVWEIPMELFEEHLEAAMENQGVESDTELDETSLQQVIKAYLKVVSAHGYVWPNNMHDQLILCIEAVLRSWGNERAVTYRELNGIPHDMGTAVNIQSMVFGNMNEESCSGVLFTRDPATGKKGLMGEFLPNAQGEDVVAGIRTPLPFSELSGWNQSIWEELTGIALGMEKAATDMQDMEFTVQAGKLFILQTRNGKRSAKAALRIAMDMLEEGAIDKPTALKRVSYRQYLTAQSPVIDPKFKTKEHGTGIAAGGGIVTGRAVFSSAAAVESTGTTILVAKETTPDDIAGMNAAVGILTSTGGATSHAAVVARGMDKACVVGTVDLEFGSNNAILNGHILKEGDKVSIDGSTGRIWVDLEVPTISAESDPAFKAFQKMALSRKKFMQVINVEDLEPICGYMVYLTTTNAEMNPADLEGALAHVGKSFANKIVVDLRGAAGAREEEDSQLWDLFGAAETSIHADAIKIVLEKAEIPGKSLTLITSESTQDEFEDWNVLRQVGSVSELLDTNGAMIQTPELAKSVGGKGKLKKLLAMLRKGGATFNAFELRATKDEILVDSLA